MEEEEERDNVMNLDKRRRLVWKTLNQTYEWQDTHRWMPRIEICRTWICRYGWDVIYDENLSAYYYWNAATGESTYDHPDYTYNELEACMRIQRQYRGYAGRRAFQLAVRSSGACQTLRSAVQDASMKAWIGYGMEGVDVKMWLCRIGLPHLSKCLNPKSNIRKRLNLKNLQVTLSELKRMSVSDLSLLGITDQVDVKQIRRIANSRDDESRAMALVHTETESLKYFARGTRAWTEILNDKKAGPLPLFKSMYRNQDIRCRSFVRDVLACRPRISLGALEHHLSQCKDRPRLAQNGISRKFVGARFTSSLQDVEDALSIFLVALRRAYILFGNMKIDVLRDKVSSVLDYVNERMKEPVEEAKHEEDEKREIEKEGKDKERLLYECAMKCRLCIAEIMRYEKLVIGIQSRFRGHKSHVFWMQYKYMRYISAAKIQTQYRMLRARREARKLRRMYDSPWEQCWEPSDCVYYFYNSDTETTCWALPDEHSSYRPYGWWPQLSKRNAQSAESDVVVCDVCSDRTATRVCRECTPKESSAEESGKYCFKCFYDVHSDAHNISHTVEACGRMDAPVLTCPVSDCPGREIGSSKSTSLASRWCRTCDKVFCGSCFARLHPIPKKRRGLRSKEPRPSGMLFDHHYAVLRTSLYRFTHTHTHTHTHIIPLVHIMLQHKGTWQHRWQSFRPGFAACIQCGSKIAERYCAECGDKFCLDCHKEFHSKGKRKFHKWTRLRESVDDSKSETYCSQCDFNVSKKKCPFCKEEFCRGCFVQHELHRCSKRFPDDHPCSLGAAKCVECGKAAERMCLQCGEAYCDQRWFGNPGCFEWFHRKGKMRTHKCAVHPRGDILRSVILIQSVVRRHLCISEVMAAKKEKCIRRLQRAWRSHAIRKETWETLGFDLGIKGIMKMKLRRAKGAMKRFGRNVMGKSSKLPPRLRIRIEVLKKWQPTDTRAELKRFIREGLEEHNVPKDRHEFLIKNIVSDVIEEKKRKLKNIEDEGKREIQALMNRDTRAT